MSVVSIVLFAALVTDLGAGFDELVIADSPTQLVVRGDSRS